MSTLLVSLLPVLARLSQSKLLGGVALVILRRIAAKTKNTLDDEVVDTITKGISCGNDEASRGS